LADDDTGTGSIDRDAAQLGRTLDHDLGDRSLRQALHDILANLEILQQQAAIVLAFGVPAAVPCTVDLQAQTDRIALVTHLLRLRLFTSFPHDNAHAAEGLQNPGR